MVSNLNIYKISKNSYCKNDQFKELESLNVAKLVYKIFIPYQWCHLL